MTSGYGACTMHVYHREGAGRPVRVVWVLEELGQPYELTIMTREEASAQEHLGRHPLGRVPVLDDGEGPIFESAAICLYLADSDPQARLLPAPGTHGRALVYQWAVFTPAELEPALLDSLRFAKHDPERAARARERFDAAAAAVSDALKGNEYLVGDRFSVADVLVGTTLAFTERGGIADQLPPGLRDYMARLTQRPAAQRAREIVASGSVAGAGS